MRASDYKQIIESIFEKVYSDCRCSVPEDQLLENGAIFYENGADGTEFDWQMNERLCEFMSYWRSSKMGFIKIFINNDGSAEYYVYDENSMKPRLSGTFAKDTFFGEKSALELAAVMKTIADDQGKFDKSINALDWNISADDSVLAENLAFLSAIEDE